MENTLIQQANKYWVRLLANDVFDVACNYGIPKRDKLKALKLVMKAIEEQEKSH